MAWPKGKPRKPQLAAEREPVHEPARAPVSNTAVDMSQWDDFEYESPDTPDRLRVPKEVIPDGMDYQWITDSVYGQPFPQRRTEFERTGWRAVPAERHDGMFMPRGHKGEIHVESCVLMERPMKYSLIARERDQREAKLQVAAREQQIRGGQAIEGLTTGFEQNHPTVKNQLNKSYEPVPIPNK